MKRIYEAVNAITKRVVTRSSARLHEHDVDGGGDGTTTVHESPDPKLDVFGEDSMITKDAAIDDPSIVLPTATTTTTTSSDSPSPASLAPDPSTTTPTTTTTNSVTTRGRRAPVTTTTTRATKATGTAVAVNKSTVLPSRYSKRAYSTRTVAAKLPRSASSARSGQRDTATKSCANVSSQLLGVVVDADSDGDKEVPRSQSSPYTPMQETKDILISMKPDSGVMVVRNPDTRDTDWQPQRQQHQQQPQQQLDDIGFVVKRVMKSVGIEMAHVSNDARMWTTCAYPAFNLGALYHALHDAKRNEWVLERTPDGEPRLVLKVGVEHANAEARKLHAALQRFKAQVDLNVLARHWSGVLEGKTSSRQSEIDSTTGARLKFSDLPEATVQDIIRWSGVVGRCLLRLTRHPEWITTVYCEQPLPKNELIGHPNNHVGSAPTLQHASHTTMIAYVTSIHAREMEAMNLPVAATSSSPSDIHRRRTRTLAYQLEGLDTNALGSTQQNMVPELYVDTRQSSGNDFCIMLRIPHMQ